MRGGLDIAVAGCGVAGLAAATLLARDGHRVTIFERFEEPGPVGSGLLLQPTGMAVLRELGLDREVIALGARIDRLHGKSNGRDVLDVHYASLDRPDGQAIGIQRAGLFDVLFQPAAEAGAEIHSGRQATGCRIAGAKTFLTFEHGSDEGPFDLIIDACGSRSPLSGTESRPMPFGALWATVQDLGGAAEPATLSQRYRRAEQMAGLLPIGGSRIALFWSVRIDGIEATRSRGIAAWRDEWARLWPEAEPYAAQISAWDSFSFACYCHRTVRRPAGDRIVHIGDSWHSTSPQLGQGANMALLDAFALAKALVAAETVSDGLAGFVLARSMHVRLYQWMSLMLTPFYQSESRAIPFLRDRIVGPISRVPAFNRLQAAMVAGLIGNPLRRLGLDRTDTFTDRASRR